MKYVLIMSLFFLFGCSETFVTVCNDVSTDCGEGGLGGSTTGGVANSGGSTSETGGVANSGGFQSGGSGGSGGSNDCQINQDPLSCWNSCSVGVLAISQGEIESGIPAPLHGDNDPKNPLFQNKFVENPSCENECVSFGLVAQEMLRERFPNDINESMTFVICNDYNPESDKPHAADSIRTDCHNASNLVIDVSEGLDPVKFDPNVYYCTSNTINGSALFPWKS